MNDIKIDVYISTTFFSIYLNFQYLFSFVYTRSLLSLTRVHMF